MGLTLGAHVICDQEVISSAFHFLTLYQHTSPSFIILRNWISCSLEGQGLKRLGFYAKGGLLIDFPTEEISGRRMRAQFCFILLNIIYVDRFLDTFVFPADFLQEMIILTPMAIPGYYNDLYQQKSELNFIF